MLQAYAPGVPPVSIWFLFPWRHRGVTWKGPLRHIKSPKSKLNVAENQLQFTPCTFHLHSFFGYLRGNAFLPFAVRERIPVWLQRAKLSSYSTNMYKSWGECASKQYHNPKLENIMSNIHILQRHQGSDVLELKTCTTAVSRGARGLYGLLGGQAQRISGRVPLIQGALLLLRIHRVSKGTVMC